MFFQDIETERLMLKSISTDDRDFIFKQFSDDDINRYLYDAEPMTSVEEADEIIEFYMQPEPRGQHRWVIIDKASGEKIGTCGFHCWNREEGSVEMGYDLQKAYWGKGYMTEALKAVLAEYIDKMGVSAVYAHIYTENERSIKLAQKLGFAFSGKTTVYNFRGEDYLHNVYTLSK